MAIPAQSLPTIGQPNASEDPKIRSCLSELQTILTAATDETNLLVTTLQKLGLNSGAQIGRGKSIIATAESTPATSYAIGNLTTPDRVQSLILPTDGLIVVLYKAIWQNSIASNGRAAIFVGASQAKVPSTVGSAPAVQDAIGSSQVALDADLITGLQGLSGGNATVNTSEVTTGQILGISGINTAGGPSFLFANAGTYDISIQFKNNSAGTTTVKNRHLWVWTVGF